VKPDNSLDEAASLERLREHERELDRRLEAASQEAARLLAEARLAAERLREQADLELRAEVERLRQEASIELEGQLAAIRRETERSVRAVSRRAEQNREQALAWLLARVAGKEPL
jgi:vacuolar-type H+-ATPase subunit H